MHFNQVRFISEKQNLFSIRNLINVINVSHFRRKTKNQVIISVGEKVAPDKI